VKSAEAEGRFIELWQHLRPGLQRALADVYEGCLDLLLVYRVDRFARSVRAIAQLLEELDRAHVHFRSATEPCDTGRHLWYGTVGVLEHAAPRA